MKRALEETVEDVITAPKDGIRLPDRKAAAKAAGLRLQGTHRTSAPRQAARKLEEHADEIMAAYLAGIRSDNPNRAYRPRTPDLAGSRPARGNR